MKKPAWWDDRGNICDLVEYLLENDADKHEILYAIMKPWKYEEEYLAGWKA